MISLLPTPQLWLPQEESLDGAAAIFLVQAVPSISVFLPHPSMVLRDLGRGKDGRSWPGGRTGMGNGLLKNREAETQTLGTGEMAQSVLASQASGPEDPGHSVKS